MANTKNKTKPVNKVQEAQDLLLQDRIRREDKFKAGMEALRKECNVELGIEVVHEIVGEDIILKKKKITVTAI